MVLVALVDSELLEDKVFLLHQADQGQVEEEVEFVGESGRV
jgi:hypothetical protein